MFTQLVEECTAADREHAGGCVAVAVGVAEGLFESALFRFFERAFEFFDRAVRLDLGAVRKRRSEAEGDSGKMSFDSNLHRVRKLIGVDDILLMTEGTLSLDLAKCWIDTLALEKVVSGIEHAAHEPSGNSSLEVALLVKELLQLYVGHFLDSEKQEAWAVAARDRFKAKFMRAVAAAGSDELRREWLPPLMSGERFCTVGISHLTTSRRHLGS